MDGKSKERHTMDFYQFFKERRQAYGSVRRFAGDYGLDPAYVSRLENGVTPPPRDTAKLQKLGRALGLTEDSAEWQQFMDLASMAKNELPEDLKNDARAASMLPAFYRTLRNEKLDASEAEELLKLIKESGKD